MAKRFRSLIPIMFLGISISVLSLVFVNLNVFKNFNFQNIFSKTSTSAEYSDNTYALNELKASYLKSVESIEYKTEDHFYSVIYDLNKDVISQNISLSSVKDDIYNDFIFLKNFIPEKVFLVPPVDGKFSELKQTDGKQFDVYSYVQECAQIVGADVVLVLTDELLYDSYGDLNSDAITEYVNKYGTNNVLISPDSSYFTQQYYDIAVFVNEKLEEINADIKIGIEIHSDFENSILDQYTEKVLSESIVDYAFVDIDRAVASEDFNFSQLAFFWNQVCNGYSVPAICNHRLDLVFTNDEDWGYGTEINEQIKSLYNYPAFDGSCFNSVSSLTNKKALARDLSIYINDVSSVFQKNLSVDSLKISENTIRFEGKANDEALIFCNDSLIKNNSGHFSYSPTLSLGYNEFDFFCNGAEYSYPVINVGGLFYNKADVSSAYDAQKNTINAFAVCPAGSVVYAVFNGNTYEMIPVYDSSVPEGLCAYSATIDLANMKISFAELSLFCGYQLITQTVSCGTFTNKNYSIADKSIISDNDVYSPFSDNGLGNSLMCIINSDNTEQISSREDYDTYHPYNSSLIKGTVDYIKNINVSPEGYLRYELYSGINVYGTDCILINNGYNLPDNNVVLKSFNDSDNSKTEFVFSVDWLIPVTVTQQQLSYEKGYQQFGFNIDEYNAEYVDVSFYYSDAIELVEGIVFSSESVFSRYEILSDDVSGKTVLRLYLKNAGKFFGFDIAKNENNEIVISFKKYASNSVAGKVIMIDAGHGGLSMVGTALPDDSVSEAQVTLSIAGRVKKYLEDRGAIVIMTREQDTSLSLGERTYMCESMNPDIFVSIHCDGSDSSSESGTHTFYFTPYSQPLADSIHNSLVKAYTEKIYTVHDRNYSNVDRKIKYYPFYVTRVDNCPSVLIETGFLTNYTEGYVLINPAHQDSIALGIADGISQYFTFI